MAIKPKKRGLSDSFIISLKSGLLQPIWHRVLYDSSLQIEIRSNYVNVYYRGGSILRIAEKRNGVYQFKFDHKYVLKGTKSRISTKLAGMVDKPSQVGAWLDEIPILKDTMDLWFGAHPKEEREFQQLVVRENNGSSIAGGTDYFIIDIEYDNHKDARFDLVAVEWESDSNKRKLLGKYKPKLCVIEMKYGDKAIKTSIDTKTGKDTAGLCKHIKDISNFLGNPKSEKDFKDEMITLFAQKRELGLVPKLNDNKNVLTEFDNGIKVLFILSNHDPESSVLASEVKNLQQIKTIPFELFQCYANDMGYGLYKNCFKQMIRR